MNYEEMSDFEINSAVTSILYNCKGWELNWTNSCFFHCGIDGSGYYSQSINDYCNNPSDAWPVIVDNEINIEFQDGGFVNAWVDNDSGSFESQIQKNPLRAAMICFLKMKDAE
ncbi:NinX [Vibrio phage 1.112.O._10N.286.46.B11]|nr:NinX [Vibrio phage 1.112.O._10N.286.46.B11]